MRDKLEAIHGAYNNHSLWYIVTIEDFLKYLQSRKYNFALWSNGVLMGKYPPSPKRSYFSIRDIKIWETIENQDDGVIECFFNLLWDDTRRI